MDQLKIPEKLRYLIKEYKYILLVLAVGMFLILIPEKGEHSVQESLPEIKEETDDDLELRLGEVLSQIEGAGKVEVLLTEEKGGRTLFQTDTDRSGQENSRTTTVIITDSGKNERGLIQQTDPAIYRGAVVVCQGADNAAVRLAIVEAVANATGLSTDKISVIKMK